MVTLQTFLNIRLTLLYLYKKLYSRSNFKEANIEEDIDLKNQFRIKNLPDPISSREAVSKDYVDNKFNYPSILKKATIQTWT